MKRLHVAPAIFLIVCQIICFTHTAHGAPPSPITVERMDQVVAAVLKEKPIPGLSIAVSMAGNKKIERTYGHANLEYSIPLEKDSVFEIGSISKTFTAIAILMLQEEGKVKVTDPVTRYFPQCPGWRDITIKHLLQHTSGIKDVTEVEPFKSNRMKDWTPQEVVARIGQEPLEFEPGQKARYSNTGCIILGLIVEKITGISFGDFLVQKIAGPLGMTNTTLGSKRVIVPKRVSGYVLSEKLLNAEYESLALPYASGAMMSTPSDLVKLAPVLKGEALISRKSAAEMCEPARLNNGAGYLSPGPGILITFGYGLDEFVRGTEVIPAKTGGISGFNSLFVYRKETDVMVALTSNLHNSLGDLLKIADRLMGLTEQ